MNNVTDLIQYLGEFEQGKLLMVLRENYIKIIQRSSLRMYDVQLDLNNFYGNLVIQQLFTFLIHRGKYRKAFIQLQ